MTARGKPLTLGSIETEIDWFIPTDNRYVNANQNGGRVNLLCHGRARASFSLTLRAGAMRLERIGRLGGAAAAGGGRDALSYGVSFATTDRNSWLRGATASFLSGIFGLALSLNPLARGCRRIWRGEIWKYGFGGAGSELGTSELRSSRQPRCPQLPGQ